MRQISQMALLMVLSCGLISAVATIADNVLPIKISSQSAIISLKQGNATYQGDVVVTQGVRKLTGDSLTITRSHDGSVKSFKAKGSPAQTQDKPNAKANMAYGQAKTIYYFPKQGLVKYVNDAKFTQDGNVFSGSVITYNTKTEVVATPKTPKSRQNTTTIILPAYDSEKDTTAS